MTLIDRIMARIRDAIGRRPAADLHLVGV